METRGNRIKLGDSGPTPTLADVALRVALWVLYGGAAGELVYGSKTIEEGMGAPLASCASRHVA